VHFGGNWAEQRIRNRQSHVQRDLRRLIKLEINRVTLHRLPSKIARKDQVPLGNDQSLMTKRSWFETSGFGHGWKVTTSVSPMEFAKDNLESSEDRTGSGRTLYIHKASRSGQPISVVFLV
jgi:hypothetical protein